MKKLINIRLDEELIKKLDEKAKEENRTRSNLIETVLWEEVEPRKAKVIEVIHEPSKLDVLLDKYPSK